MRERFVGPAARLGLKLSFAGGLVFRRLRSGPFEGPATEKPPALPEDDYYSRHSAWEVSQQAAGRMGRGFHSTFTHLRGGLDSEFRKLLIPLNLDEPPRRHCRLFSIYGHFPSRKSHWGARYRDGMPANEIITCLNTA